MIGDLSGLRASTDGYGTVNDACELTLARASGLPSIEIQPRPYGGRLVDGSPEFKLPNYAVLLRIATLNYMEAFARAAPDLLTGT